MPSGQADRTGSPKRPSRQHVGCVRRSSGDVSPSSVGPIRCVVFDRAFRQKLTEAVDAINTTVEAIPDTTALGLRSYAGSCNQSSVPVLVPIGLDNDDQIVAAANNLSAGGGTPTTAALDAGIDELLAYPSAGTKRLVLLTDGDTQCGISAYDFIKQKDLGSLELTLYTVGLQVSPVAAADLQCAAEYTGGTYIPADDPTDLADALGEATGGFESHRAHGNPPVLGRLESPPAIGRFVQLSKAFVPRGPIRLQPLGRSLVAALKRAARLGPPRQGWDRQHEHKPCGRAG